ncbi:hypothetical protein N9O57_02150 [bacterium]|nr:hypothetical protein [bacterium]
MNKIAIFIFLILVYLGLSKSFSPSEKKTLYISNERVYGNYFKNAPIEVVLIDAFQIGFLIKTYFHKYKVIHGFKHPEETIIRVSKRFFERNEHHIGMSLFRRSEVKDNESNIPMYPGYLFVGDPAYGRWTLHDSGQKYWKFYRAYRLFPEHLHWGDFRPSKKFHKEAELAYESTRTFFGLNNEFGTKGEISMAQLKRYEFKVDDVSLKKIINKHFGPIKKKIKRY